MKGFKLKLGYKKGPETKISRSHSYLSTTLLILCDASGIPMWMYLGGQDSSTINNAGKASFNALEDCQNNAEKKLTTFSAANHFNASIWPFLPEGNRQIDSDSDAVTQDLLQWFLSQE